MTVDVVYVTAVDPTPEIIEVTVGDLVGPEGPEGPPGAVGSSYEYTQVATASSWVIDHNMGFLPNVTVEEVGTGIMLMCAEIHHTSNQVELQFNTPRAGTARLS